MTSCDEKHIFSPIKKKILVEFERLNKISSSLNVKDFNKICRTCLSERNVRPILTEYMQDNTECCNVLEQLTEIQVTSNESLPQNICIDCIQQLHNFISFKKQVLANEIILKDVLNQSIEDAYILECKESQIDYEMIALSTENKSEQNPGDIFDHNIETDNFDGISSDDGKPLILRAMRRKKSNNQSNKKNKFNCMTCSVVFDTRDELKKHRTELQHTEHRNHSCDICKKKFTSSKLKQHMRVHTKEKPYKCNICDQTFSMSGNLKRHMMTHTGERPHVCKLCNKGFIQFTSLQAHMKTHQPTTSRGGEKFFMCEYCGKIFKRSAPYNAHLKKHNSRDEEDNEESKEEIIQKIEEDPQHICTICNKGYKTKHLLKAHAATHGEKTFLCSDCGKGFVTKASLQSHLKVHTGEKPYNCTVCTKSFAHVSSFDSHMLTHLGVKPHSCKHCSKSFTQLSHLKYHLRTHSGERPYECTYCNKSFALKGNLTVHVRTHTGETPYLCTICGKGFYDSSSMKKHRKSHRSTQQSSDFRESDIEFNSGEIVDNYFPPENQEESLHTYQYPAVPVLPLSRISVI